MRKVFVPLTIVAAALFMYAPVAIAQAPFESTMGLVQKIFYFHVPSWIAMFTGVFIAGIASAVYLFTRRADADRLAASAVEVALVFGLIGLVTGPLWGRKAWGVWWQWDARLTTALLLELILFGYLLVRAYGGPGSDKLAAAMAIFGMANVPFVYLSVNLWRTVHPKTTVIPEMAKNTPAMFGPFVLSAFAFMLLFALLLTARLHLERQRAALDRLYLLEEDRA